MPDKAAKTSEDPLVAKAFDADKHVELAEAVAQLSPEEAAYFVAKLEGAIRKRKIQITGYLVAMLAWVAGMLFALAWYGTHDGFVGWVFVMPFGVVGVILYAFGRWSERVAANFAKLDRPHKATKPARPK